MNIPAGYQAVMPYLILIDANKFIAFVQAVFGAELKSSHMREDSTTIMHAEVIIGGSTVMFAEATDQYHQQAAGLFVYVDNADTCYHSALENGAASLMELSDQPYGRTCGVKDPCGNTWWVTSVR